jgi:hypothetical protein
VKYILSVEDLKNLCDTCVSVESAGLKVAHFVIDSECENISMILDPVVIAKTETKE